MLVVCPYPECRSIYEAPGQDDFLLAGDCESCGKTGTRRSEAAWERLRAIQRTKEDSISLLESPQINFGLSAVVEDVRSLWNVGSMFRSADAAGIDKLYLCGITGAPRAVKSLKQAWALKTTFFGDIIPTHWILFLSSKPTE